MREQFITFLHTMKYVALLALAVGLLVSLVCEYNQKSADCDKKGGAYVQGHCLPELR